MSCLTSNVKDNGVDPSGGLLTMRSYIKVCGPPVMEAIRALEMIAIEMPEVSIMDTIIVQGLPSHLARDVGVSPRRATGSTPRGQFAGNWAINYFRSSRVAVPVERSVSIISDAGESLGTKPSHRWAVITPSRRVKGVRTIIETVQTNSMIFNSLRVIVAKRGP
jgi:hypothetical protein